MDFGAVGDGTTDDTDALQNAISVAEGTGGVVWLPANSTYLITSGLTDIDNMILRGSGPTSVILANCSGEPALQTRGASNIRFENFQIDGSSGTATYGIYMNETVQVTIDQVIIDGGGVGFTSAGIALDGDGDDNCFAVHVTNATWVTSCVGDGLWAMRVRGRFDDDGGRAGRHEGYGV